MKVVMSFLLLGCIAQAAEVLASLRDTSYVHEVLLVSDEDFTVQRLKETAKRFLSTNTRVAFASLEIGTGSEVGYYAGKGTDHVNEENYFHRLTLKLSEGTALPMNIASLIKIGSWKVLRVRIGNKTYTYNLGRVTPVCFANSPDLEILHLGPLFSAPKSIGGIEVYVRSRQNVQQEEALRLAECLKRHFARLTFRILVRADAWFVTDPNFPFLYAFDEPASIPTSEKYERRQTTVMGVAP